MTRPPGSAIGRYQIQGFMARGETTIIYRAQEPESGRDVALKILPPSAARDAANVKRFLRLAELQAGLEQSNLLPVVDYGREDGVPFVATPVAEGGGLSEHRSAYAEPKAALTLVAALARALDYLHQHDVIHGRIAANHILFDAQNQPLLTGYGRPYTAGDSGPAPPYMAPEQRQGLAPDGQTDIYQLGALLYDLLLGAPPDPEVAPQLSALPEDVQIILSRALAAEPGDRFLTAGELAGHLAGAAQDRAAPASEPEIPPAAPQSDPLKPAAAESVPGPPSPAAVNKDPIWLAAAVVGLSVMLTICCLLAIFGLYSAGGRFREPRATAQVDTNVRAGPTVAYEIVGILRQGETTAVHGVSSDGRWWQIAFDDGPESKGWVPAAFVTVDPSGSVEVIRPPAPVPEAALPNPLFHARLRSSPLVCVPSSSPAPDRQPASKIL